VALVGAAHSAVHLRAQHEEEAAIHFSLDVLLIYGRVEARPARAESYFVSELKSGVPQATQR
jgi:hypothetical protein